MGGQSAPPTPTGAAIQSADSLVAIIVDNSGMDS
jgi:hypothetical protein